MPLIRPNEHNRLLDAYSKFRNQLIYCMDDRVRNAEQERIYGRFFTDRTFTTQSLKYIIKSDQNESNLSTIQDMDASNMRRGEIEIENIRMNVSDVSRVQTMSREPIYRNSGVLKLMKQTFLCAFEMTNNGETYKINKQQLYTFLFMMGLPTGLIAKIILDGNVGGVRNGILTHKEFIKGNWFAEPMAKAYHQTGGKYTTMLHTAMVCFNVGGINLLDKYLKQTDLRAVVGRGTDVGGMTIYSDDFYKYQFNMISKAEYVNLAGKIYAGLSSQSGAQRGVRRTGQTLSRNATTPRETIIILERSTPSAPAPVDTTVLATPTGESVGRSQATTSREPRTKVRDVPFTNTFGIEIEGSFMRGITDSVGANYWDKMKGVLTNYDFTTDTISSSGEKRGTGKLNVSREGGSVPEGHWKYKGDGSVHGGDPYEFASPILKGKNGIDQVKMICSAMRQSGFYSNATAGVHVHLGARDLELQTFKNIMYNYTKFEPLIEVIFTSDRRWSNPYYAQSFSKIPNWEEVIERPQTFNQLVDVLQGTRYWTCNLYAFGRFGTIEFRKLMGTNDDRLIIWFTYFLHYLMEASKRKKLTNFNLKGLQDILPAWAFTYFVDRARNTSGYDLAYGYDVGSKGATGDRQNTYTRGGDPMGTPLQTSRGQNRRRRNNDFSE